jgi:hypothetical protein
MKTKSGLAVMVRTAAKSDTLTFLPDKRRGEPEGSPQSIQARGGGSAGPALILAESGSHAFFE